MTTEELILAVELGLDKSASFQIAAFEPEDFVYWLNEAQTALVKQKMFGNNARREDYDTGIKRADDLSKFMVYSPELIYNLVNTSPDFRPHAYHPNIAKVNTIALETPGNKYMFYIGADFRVTPSGTVGIPNPLDQDNQVLETTFIEQKDIGHLVETPYNKPYLKNGYVYLKEDEVHVIYDPYVTPHSLYVSFLRKPLDLALFGEEVTNISTNDCEFPLQMQPELVALTVSMLLENIEGQRYQTNQFELNRKE